MAQNKRQRTGKLIIIITYYNYYQSLMDRFDGKIYIIQFCLLFSQTKKGRPDEGEI